jgi:hypothetical protein
VEDTRNQRQQASKHFARYSDVIPERRARDAAVVLALVEHLASIDETLMCIAAGIRSLATRIEHLERAFEERP